MELKRWGTLALEQQYTQQGRGEYLYSIFVAHQVSMKAKVLGASELKRSDGTQTEATADGAINISGRNLEKTEEEKGTEQTKQ